MKKAIILFLTLIIICCFAVPANAAGTASLSTDNDIRINEQINMIPVMISDNPGFLSFKIICKYDPELIDIVSVIPGEVTSKGTIFHNLGLHTNEVDISWYDVVNHYDDGVLFVLALRAKSRFTDGSRTEISIDYSQEDTFDSEFKDVTLKCSPIILNCGEVIFDPEIESVDDNENDSLTDEQIVSVINAEISNSDLESINEANDQILARVNADLQIVSGKDRIGFSSVSEMKSAYKTALIGEYSKKLENEYGDELSTKASQVLNLDEVTPYSELSEEEKVTVIKNLLPSDNLDSIPKTIIDSIETEATKGNANQSTNDEIINQNKDSYFWIVIVCIAIVLLTIIIVARFKKSIKVKKKAD